MCDNPVPDSAKAVFPNERGRRGSVWTLVFELGMDRMSNGYFVPYAFADAKLVFVCGLNVVVRVLVRFVLDWEFGVVGQSVWAGLCVTGVPAFFSLVAVF